MSFEDFLSAEIQRSGISQNQMAARVNISGSILSRKLSGARQLTFADLRLIARELDVPLWELLYRWEVSNEA